MWLQWAGTRLGLWVHRAPRGPPPTGRPGTPARWRGARGRRQGPEGRAGVEGPRVLRVQSPEASGAPAPERGPHVLTPALPGRGTGRAVLFPLLGLLIVFQGVLPCPCAGSAVRPSRCRHTRGLVCRVPPASACPRVGVPTGRRSPGLSSCLKCLDCEPAPHSL